MTKICAFADVIGLWQNASVMATACNAVRSRLGIDLKDLTGNTVRGWRGRGIIPPIRFPEVAEAAREWGHEQVTVAVLNDLYNALPPSQPAPPVQASAADFG